MNRVKPDHPPTRAGKAAKYLQPSGVPVCAYIPTSLNGELENFERVLLITEGEKKALAGSQAGFITIGLTGVDCWHATKSSATIPDLERVGLTAGKYSSRSIPMRLRMRTLPRTKSYSRPRSRPAGRPSRLSDSRPARTARRSALTIFWSPMAVGAVEAA